MVARLGFLLTIANLCCKTYIISLFTLRHRVDRAQTLIGSFVILFVECLEILCTLVLVWLLGLVTANDPETRIVVLVVLVGFLVFG